ncbi:hypothetical protein BD309DRAFT_978057 [Dichomitus squalens]|nr:hypothetical protein BD309DRAFT_978057 [Dichomitus squalens]
MNLHRQLWSEFDTRAGFSRTPYDGPSPVKSFSVRRHGTRPPQRSLQVNHETRGHGVLRPRPVLASHGIFAVKLGPPAKGSWTLSSCLFARYAHTMREVTAAVRGVTCRQGAEMILLGSRRPTASERDILPMQAHALRRLAMVSVHSRGLPVKRRDAPVTDARRLGGRDSKSGGTRYGRLRDPANSERYYWQGELCG